MAGRDNDSKRDKFGHGFIKFVLFPLLVACVAGFFTDWFGCSNLLPVHVPSVRDFMELVVKSSIMEMTEDMVKNVGDVHSEEFVRALTNGHSSDPSMMDEEIAPYVSLADFFDVATSHMECEVTSVNVDRDVAVAHVSVRNINVASVLREWYGTMSDRSQWPSELQELAEEAEAEKTEPDTSGNKDDDASEAISSLMRVLTSTDQKPAGQSSDDSNTKKSSKKATSTSKDADATTTTDSADETTTGDPEERLQKKLADWGWSLFKDLIDDASDDDLVETDVTVTYRRSDSGKWEFSSVSGFSSAIIGSSETDLIKTIIASSAMGEQD